MLYIYAAMARSGGFSLAFWFKIIEGTRVPASDAEYRADERAVRRFVFFTQLAPPKALLTIEMRADFVEARFFGSCAAGDVEDAEIATCVRRERRFVYLDE
jgi:hypothetical protein